MVLLTTATQDMQEIFMHRVKSWHRKANLLHIFARSWWRQQMETFSALLALCVVNSPVTGEFHAQKPVTRSFDVSFDLRLNKRLSKQSWGWWFETPSRSLWRYRNVCDWNLECLAVTSPLHELPRTLLEKQSGHVTPGHNDEQCTSNHAVTRTVLEQFWVFTLTVFVINFVLSQIEIDTSIRSL